LGGWQFAWPTPICKLLAVTQVWPIRY